MLLTIYDSAGIKQADIAADDSSTQVKEVQGDNVLALSFTYYEYIVLGVNSYIDFEGERYWITDKYTPNQKNEREWKYEVKLYGIESLIKRFLVLETTDGDTEPVFRLTATPREHVAMVVKCINDGMGHTTDWKVGQVDGSKLIVIDYEGKYCDAALKEIAEAVGGKAEWWIEGQTVNVCRCERGEEITLAYGAGLTELNRDTSNTGKFYTRLFPIGSTRNIDPARYGYSRLMLPGGKKYIEVGAEEYGIYDHYEQKAFSNIYPRRVGKVSSVRSEDVTDANGNTFTIYHFRDDTIPFDPNDYELPDEKKRVSFQDGELEGLGSTDDHYFEVNFNSDTREFEIITIWPYDDDVQLPGGNLVPKPGDRYILWNVSMPDEYYQLAEEEFLTAVEQYNEEYWLDISVYKAPTDHVWIEENNISLYVGRRVKLVSEAFFPDLGYRQSRITKITRKVNLPSQMDLEISDALHTGALDKLNDDVATLRNYTKSMAECNTLPDIIHSWDNTQPTDNNIYSARRTHKEFVSKQKDDTAQGFIRFIKGLQVGEHFVTGLLGEGGVFRREDDGTTFVEADKLYIRMKAYFDNVEIRDYRHSSGNRIASSAGARCCRVEYIGADGAIVSNTQDAVIYRCYFRGSDGEDEVRNNFVIGDQAYCHITSVETSQDSPGAKGLNMKHFWRLVVGRNPHGTLTDNGEHWIDLSNRSSETVTIGGTSYTHNGYQSGSDVPAAHDDIIQLGNINDTDRMGAIIEFVTGADSPSYQVFQGINDFSLVGKSYVGLGYSTQTGRAYLRVYGDAFIGDPDESTYMKYDSVNRQLHIKAIINAQSTIDGQTIADFIAQNTWTEEQITGMITDETDPLFSDYDTAIKNIQKQIDGSIETWFYNGIPGPSSLPESEWKEKDQSAGNKNERLKHLGDLYYDNQTGYAYRYTNTGTENVPQFEWKPISDSAVVKALSDASKAQDTADNKRRVFFSQPVPPYDEGDLWVNATYPAGNTNTDDALHRYSNDVLRCDTAKESGEVFSISDWKLASKYTDDSALDELKANQYVQQLIGGTISQDINDAQTQAANAANAANAAQAAADSAQADADEANGRLDGWASDGVISPTEKTALRLEWADVKKEYAQICNDADKYGISKTDFASAYASANSAYTKYTAATPENITIGADYDNIAAYYAARQTILDTISVAAKKVATDAQAKADSAYNLAGQAETHAAAFDAIRQALNNGTLMDGGLVLSTLIGLRDENNTMWSGISGAYNVSESVKGHGIAAWFGGGMADKEMLTATEIAQGWETHRWARSLFRFDGSGYVANGDIAWDATGLKKVTASKISALEMYLGEDAVATQKWAEQKFLTISFFNRLFRAYSGNTLVPANSDDNIDNIKAMFGFWTDKYISALGKSDSVGGSGATALSDLTDVLVGSQTQGQVLGWDGNGHWIPMDMQGGSDTKNTAGSMNLQGAGAKLYIVGATSQTPVGVETFSNSKCYIGTDDCLYSNGEKVLTSAAGYVTGIIIGGESTPRTPTNGIVSIPKIPTSVSELTNDSGYLTSITKSQVESVLTGNITSHTHNYLNNYGNDGVLEVARYIDFHTINNGVVGSEDYSVRLDAGTSTGRSFSFPSTGGILAITSDIPTNTNQLTNGAGFITSAAISDMVTKSGTQTITGAKTFTDIRLYGQPENPNMPYFLGIDVYAVGGAIKYIGASKVCSAIGALPASSYTASDVLSKIKTVDGSGSGLDADLLDGLHNGSLTAKELSVTNTVTVGVTVATAKNNLLNAVKGYAFGNVATVGAALIALWDNDSVTTFDSSKYSIINVTPQYNGDNYGQYLLFHYGTLNPAIIGRNDGNWTSVKYLAFTTDNVASATKLQTPRTIWGQSFDGTGNVSGNMTGVGNITASGGTYKFLTYPTSLYGLVVKMEPTGLVKMQSQREANDTETFALSLNPLGGNVGIGTTTPAYKLDVSGDTMTRGWLRTTGDAGWYSQDYQGGIYMVDTNWIRTFNYKALLVDTYNQNYWGIGGHRLSAAFTSNDHTSILLAVKDKPVSYGICVNQDGNMYIGKRTNGTFADTTNDAYLFTLNSTGLRIGDSGSPTYRIEACGDILATGWLRTSGDTGWYSNKYGGGWYMVDSSWVRTYNEKSIYTGNGAIYTETSVRIGGCTISWDSTNNALKFDKTIYSEGGVSALGLSGSGSGTSGDYLPLTGGTLSGSLSISNGGISLGNGNISVAGGGTFAADVKLYGKGINTRGSGRAWSWGGDPGQHYVGNDSSTVYMWTEGGYAMKFGTNNSERMRITSDGNVLIGSTGVNGFKLFVNGVGGGTSAWSSTSDMRLKNRIDDVDVSLDSIANAPLFRFTWKDINADRNLHIGTSAQYWKSIAPEVVVGGIGDYYGMEYGVTALIAAITTARKVKNHEQRIKQLENENRELRQIISELKAA